MSHLGEQDTLGERQFGFFVAARKEVPINVTRAQWS
jgi:hypothetical protein